MRACSINRSLTRTNLRPFGWVLTLKKSFAVKKGGSAVLRLCNSAVVQFYGCAILQSCSPAVLQS